LLQSAKDASPLKINSSVKSLSRSSARHFSKKRYSPAGRPIIRRPHYNGPLCLGILASPHQCTRASQGTCDFFDSAVVPNSHDHVACLKAALNSNPSRANADNPVNAIGKAKWVALELAQPAPLKAGEGAGENRSLVDLAFAYYVPHFAKLIMDHFQLRELSS